MVGHELSLVAMQRNLIQGTAVGLGEIGHFKITFQNFSLAQEACLDDLMILELLLGADNVIASIEIVDLVG